MTPIQTPLVSNSIPPTFVSAAIARLRQLEDWEEPVKTGCHVPGPALSEVSEAWLAEQALACTGQTLARPWRVLGLYERWREGSWLLCRTIEQIAARRHPLAGSPHRKESLPQFAVPVRVS